MVSISAAIGFFLAPTSTPWFGFIWMFLGVFLVAGGSCGINEYQEKDFDAKMKRTSKRPIPSGRISAGAALFLSLFFVFLGVRLLLYNGILPALLGIANVLLYNLLYTPLKTKSPLSILPGALVGAVPPIIGWTSAGANPLDLPIIYIAIFMFLWQIPHFWLLLIMFGKEYEEAGFYSISKYFSTSQIKYLVFIWILLTSVFIFFFPIFNIELSPLLITFLLLINFGFISIFYYLIFKKNNLKSLHKAFIAINSYMLLVLLVFILNLLV